jgi:hypothetical protein
LPQDDVGVDDDPVRANGSYRAARIAVAVALTGVLALLLVLDAVSPEYDLNYVTLTALLTTILTLFGIEVGAAIFGRKK